VHVHALEPGRPHDAVLRSVRDLVDRFPRARDVTLLPILRGAHPGSTISPWTYHGIGVALREQRGRYRSLGGSDPGPARCDLARWSHAGSFEPPASLARRLAMDGIEAHATRPTVDLHVPGLRGSARIPRAWIGTSLVMLAPMIHHREGGGAWKGPVQSALDALGRCCGGHHLDACALGARVAAEVFADTVLVLDGTWWAAVDEGAGGITSLSSVEHIVATSTFADLSLMATMDAWLDARLGIAHAITTQDLRIEGNVAAWPRVGVLPRSEGLGWTALWRRNDGKRVFERPFGNGGRAHLALPPHAPGRFAYAWHVYERSGRAVISELAPDVSPS